MCITLLDSREFSIKISICMYVCVSVSYECNELPSNFQVRFPTSFILGHPYRVWSKIYAHLRVK